MNLLLQALKGVVIAPNAVKETATTKAVKEVGKRVSKTPDDGADVRIHHTGKVYPAAHLVDKYDLEYTAKGGNRISNGIDLFKALDWSNYTKGGNTQPLLLGYVIPMNQPKIELFAGTRYDNDGNPINSVLEQGSALSDETLELIATGLGYSPEYPLAQDAETKETVEPLKSAWEVMLGDKKFVDLKLEDAQEVFTMSDGKYFIPKAFNKGEKKGTFSTVKREKINIMLVTEYSGNAVVDTQDTENYTETPVEDYPYDNTSEGEEVSNEEISEVLAELGEDSNVEDLLAVHQQFENQEA